MVFISIIFVGGCSVIENDGGGPKIETEEKMINKYFVAINNSKNQRDYSVESKYDEEELNKGKLYETKENILVTRNHNEFYRFWEYNYDSDSSTEAGQVKTNTVKKVEYITKAENEALGYELKEKYGNSEESSYIHEVGYEDISKINDSSMFVYSAFEATTISELENCVRDELYISTMAVSDEKKSTSVKKIDNYYILKIEIELYTNKENQYEFFQEIAVSIKYSTFLESVIIDNKRTITNSSYNNTYPFGDYVQYTETYAVNYNFDEKVKSEVLEEYSNFN